MIQNVEYTVPAQVKNLFYGYVGFGDEYVIYTQSRLAHGSAVYTLLLRKAGSSTFKQYTCTYNGSDYVVSSSDSSQTEISVVSPYYAYSSNSGNGIVEITPSMHGTGILCMIIIAGCLVLRTVFGGIKVWSNRKRV